MFPTLHAIATCIVIGERLFFKLDHQQYYESANDLYELTTAHYSSIICQASCWVQYLSVVIFYVNFIVD